MTEQKNNSKSKKTSEIFSGLLEYFTISFVKDLQAKIKRAFGTAVKKTIASIVLILGFIFLLVGLAQIIGRATGYGNGAGYAI
ncbi:MAG: hypothetical protein P4L58_04010, partial [Candidatus Pacebacteria bacterium]|nr:hypothetical protein [Candidatus Paceibacterota bacterium]